jgi:hypothetical protein
MIDPAGACVSNKTASTDRNYRRAFALNLTLPAALTSNRLGTIQEWEFPALEATYCPTGDAVCSSCIQEKFWFSPSPGDSRFCVGSGGCVCIHTCELFPLQGPPCSDTPGVPAVTTRMTPSTAPTPTPTPTSSSTPTSPIAKNRGIEPDSKEWWDRVRIGMVLFAGCCILSCVLCCWMCKGVCKDESRRRRRQRRLTDDAAIPVDDSTVRSTATSKDETAYREMQ